VRTLIISDLHLGGRLPPGLLTRPEPLSRLLDALDGIDRLVLLGDTVELIEGRPQHALQVAEPVLRAIGGRMGEHREVTVVPGNHDAPLIRAWVRAIGPELRHDSVVDHDATQALARLVSWLAPARVRVRYPGLWLSDNVWATHGHYLDQHLLPISAWGLARGLRASPSRHSASPSDYEAAGRPAVAPLTRLLPRPLAALLDDVAELARASTMPRLSKRLIHRRVAPVTAMLLGTQMRRAAIPALAHVVHRLGIDAEHVVFGHVHRVGPLPGDDLSQWQGPSGGPRIVNTGSWVYEPLLLHRTQPPHPYWPGGAVLLEPDQPPRVTGLLDELPVEALH
jgi:Calcineurin-like phosphoesterase